MADKSRKFYLDDKGLNTLVSSLKQLIPTSLKNPSSLTVQQNGKSTVVYDGSSVKTVNITPAGIGAAAASHEHTKSEITDMPTTLPNPSSLVIHTVNGMSGQVSSTVYDGTESKAIAITSSAIGAALSNEVYKIKEITKTTDWNTLTDTGIYHIKTTECTNCPTTNHGTLYTNGSITTIFQMFIPDVGKVIYKRYRSGEVWSSWITIGLTDSEKSKLNGIESGAQTTRNYVGLLPMNANLDNYKGYSTGVIQYYAGLIGVATDSTMSNCPESNTSLLPHSVVSFNLKIWRGYIGTPKHVEAIFQEYENITTGAKYIRTYLNKSWTVWLRCTYPADELKKQLYDSGWTSLKCGDGMSAYSASDAPVIRRVGHVVELKGILRNSTTFPDHDSLLTGIPTDMCPKTNVWSVQQGDGMNRWFCIVSNDGKVKLERYGTTSSIRLPVNQCLPIHATWTV